MNRLEVLLDQVIAWTKMTVDEMKARAPGEYEGPRQDFMAYDFETELVYLEDLRRRIGAFSDQLQADIAGQCERFTPIMNEVGNILAEFSSTGLSQEDLPKALRPSLDAFQNAIRGIQTFDPFY